MRFQKAIKLLFLFLFLSLQFWGQIPAKPNPPRYVNDYSALLSKPEADELESKLSAYNDSTSSAIVIVIMKTIEMDEGEFAAEILLKWGVGQAGKDNGIAIVITTEQPRKVFIGTGYGIEPILTDALCKRTVEEVIIPRFKEKQYFTGLNEGINQIISILKGEFKGDKKKRTATERPNFIWIILIIVLLAIMFGGKGRGGRGYSRTFGGPFIGGLPQGGSWGGGSFGGGFGGFGGGSGGGGGAGGRW